VNSYSKRKYLIILIFVLVGGAFLIKLFSLQVLDQKYKNIATRNVLREVVNYPSRGLIYDRNMQLMVYNQAAYDLVATPREIGVFDTLRLCSLLDISPEMLDRALYRAKQYSWYRPSIVVRQIPPEKYAYLQERMYHYPGFYFQTRTLRKYAYDVGAHVLGYVGEASQNVLDSDSYYSLGDYYGVTGLENVYENKLRGKKGASYFLVDVHNRVKGSYNKGRLDVPPQKGSDLVSTIDVHLQQYGELLMNNKAGSIVAIEPSTGEILALVTSPAYSPNEMVGRSRAESFPRLVADTLLPLYNRAVRAQYPPGSTFKMINALVALQEGVISPGTRFMCNYGYHVGSFSMKCTHDQEISLSPSIARSCNAYYAHIFRRTLESGRFSNVKEGYEAWREHLLTFGFSTKISTEFKEELAGLIPDAEYYQHRVFPHSRWRALPIISLSIGQGEIMITPLQMANYAAILANRGYYFAPHLVKEFIGENNDTFLFEKHNTSIDSVNFDLILDGMEQVMSIDHRGTAAASHVPGIRICGKTGTVENPHGVDHSSFIAFAPRDNPQIALVVYVENGKWGSSYAAPIATLMIEMYLNGSIQPSRKQIEKRMLETNLLFPDEPGYVKYEQE
jgi:penicillin-binding protein 2